MENEDYRERKRPGNWISGRKALQSRFLKISQETGRQEKEIKGIQIGKEELKLPQIGRASCRERV